MWFKKKKFVFCFVWKCLTQIRQVSRPQDFPKPFNMWTIFVKLQEWACNLKNVPSLQTHSRESFFMKCCSHMGHKIKFWLGDEDRMTAQLDVKMVKGWLCQFYRALAPSHAVQSNVYVPPRTPCWNPNSQCDGTWKGGHWVVIMSWESLCAWDVCAYERNPRKRAILSVVHLRT